LEFRLIEMLHDDDIAVQVSVAESLVTGVGRSGLVAVLQDLRERLEDPDTDRMVTKLDELQGSGRAQILQEARTILAEGTTPAIQLAIAEIERLFGYYI
jgi:hypothetical protein